MFHGDEGAFNVDTAVYTGRSFRAEFAHEWSPALGKEANTYVTFNFAHYRLPKNSPPPSGHSQKNEWGCFWDILFSLTLKLLEAFFFNFEELCLFDGVGDFLGKRYCAKLNVT